MHTAQWRTLTQRTVQLLTGVSFLGVVALVAHYVVVHGAFTPATTGRDLVSIVLCALAFVFFLSVLLLRATSGGIPALWRMVLTFSLLCIVGMGAIWYLVTNAVREDPGVGTPILTQAAADSYLAPYVKPASGSTAAAPLEVPTGVFIQSIEFSSASNVVVTGYIWQKYADNFPADVARGFVLPEAEDAYDATEAYTKTVSGGELIGWYFKATLRQQFFYADYPFDRQDVWLRMWHRDFDRGALLVPDFTSYGNMAPAALSGLESQFVQEGWSLEHTFFSYNLIQYNTSFGLGPYTVRDPFPELYFNVGLKRDFLSAFIGHIIPLTVVAFLLFAVLITSTKDERKAGIIGFNTYAVLGYCAALFFVVIIDHIQLRNAIAAQSIMYLEYFYFVLYLAILMVSLNAILLTTDTYLRIIEYKENVIPKLLYWPVILGILLIATVVDFYIA
jgi:hypothetical protein